jgi:CubicO group peptidase (beta-lactamase class C family)/peptidoglycan/LPS O-acetylase OafA/YrhL
MAAQSPPSTIQGALPTKKPSTPRDGFLDTLRAVATVRVVFWHAYGAPLLSFVIASMPTMFFVAGSLLAASLDRQDFRTVLRDRLCRLLIPFWLFGATVITAMALSRVVTSRSDTALSATRLFGWIVPLVDPKGSDWEAGWLSQPLWYLRAFIWLLLAAPILRNALRRFGNVVFVPPILVVFATDFFIRHPNAAPPGFSTWRWYTGDFALYSIFLMLGFLHRDGVFRALRTSARIEWGAIAGSCAALWCTTQPVIRNVVNNSYPAHLFVGATWLFIFLASENVLAKGPSTRFIGPLIQWLTQRSLTVYLWHTTTIVCADYLLNRFAPHATRLLVIPIVVVLIPLCAAAFGWAEDLSAGRKARLWPMPLPFAFPASVSRVSPDFVRKAKDLFRTLTTSHPGIEATPDNRPKSVPSANVLTPNSKGLPLLTGFFGFVTAMAVIAVAPLTGSGLSVATSGPNALGSSGTEIGKRKPPTPSARPDTAVFETATTNIGASNTPADSTVETTVPVSTIPIVIPSAIPAAISNPIPVQIAVPANSPAAQASTKLTGSTPNWTEVPPDTATKLQAVLDTWMTEMKVSGATIALGRPDGTLWKAGSGSMGPNDQVDITSITKTFTSALTMALADEGKIALDTEVPSLNAVPTFPKATGITARQLLQHSSGLSTYQDTPEYLANPAMSLTPAQAVSLAAKQRLLWSPGTNSGYSSSGYLTLGLLAEQAGGGTYKSQLENRFFGPLGLKNTFVDETPIAGWIGFSTGGVKSTMEDLTTWGAALYRDQRVVSKQASAEIIDVSNNFSVGLGAWPVCPCSADTAGKKIFTSIGHNGGNGALEYSPADRIVIAGFLSEPIFNSRITQQDLYDLFARLRLAAI